MASKKSASKRNTRSAAAEPFSLERVPDLLESTLSSKSFAATSAKITKAIYDDLSVLAFPDVP